MGGGSSPRTLWAILARLRAGPMGLGVLDRGCRAFGSVVLISYKIGARSDESPMNRVVERCILWMRFQPYPANAMA